MKEKFDFYDNTSIRAYNLDEKIRYQLKMLDSLDAFTRKHSEHVASITCRLCENLNLDKDFTVYCITCAYLHDVGKIFIPPEVLQKPSKLTDEEYSIMKTHTTIGYKICMNDLKLRPYAAGALYHHEGLDGSGYPNGVRGNKIPYEAQIIRVADEYEAITAKRQYKSHIGIIDALNILIDHAKPSNLPDRKFGEPNWGKIDKKILKALVKVIIEDTEMEIVNKDEYAKFLKGEIKRVKGAEKYFKKMQSAKTQDKYEYHKEEVKCFLKMNEDPEKLPEIIEEFENAYNERLEQIKKLYDEIKQIKKLTI